jgi:hypothetical protein
MTEGTSPIDEAFALLLLENAYDLCWDMATSTQTARAILSQSRQKEAGNLRARRMKEWRYSMNYSSWYKGICSSDHGYVLTRDPRIVILA